MAHSAAAGHHGDSHHDAAHGSMKSYIVGFILSIVLTLGSFGLVMVEGVSRSIAIPGLIILCVAQLLVQLIFFLHMGMDKSQRENTLTFVFTVKIIAIIVVGSLWVLHNMNVNMMPGM